jgi:hypothetical protein
MRTRAAWRLLAFVACSVPAIARSAESTEIAAPVKPKSPFRGSTITYEHAISALTLDKAAELTYNPYYVHRLWLRPEVHYGDYLYGAARLYLAQELTDADDTTKKREVFVSDLLVWLGAKEIPLPLGLSGSADVMLTFPTSKASRAQTMVLGFTPGVGVSKKLDVLSGLTVGLTARGGFYFNRYTTTQLESPWVACASPDVVVCGRYVHTGERNAKSLLSAGPSVDLSITDELALSGFFLVRRYGLYDLADAAAGSLSGRVQPTDGAADVSVRYEELFILEATYDLTKTLQLALGAFNVYPQLAPSSSYRFPLFNRSTELYLSIAVKVDEVIGTP